MPDKHGVRTPAWQTSDLGGSAKPIKCDYQQPLDGPFLNRVFSRGFREGKRPTKAFGERPIKVGKRPIKEGNNPLTLMGSFRASYHGGKRPL